MRKLMFFATALLAGMPAWAQEAAAHGGMTDKLYIPLGAGFMVGLAALGGTLAQGKIGASAMDGIARNPQAGKDMFTPMIIGLVFAESLVIFGWVLAFLFQQKF